MSVLHYASRTVVTLALVGLSLGGCSGDSTAPDSPFDPSGTSSDVTATGDAFNSTALLSYGAVSLEINAIVGGSVGEAVLAMPTSSIVSSRAGAMRYATKLARAYTATGQRPSFAAARIPDEHLGTTFVYDLEAGAYVASELTGAPANGVRFILYAVNNITGELLEPLVEIGHADITGTQTTNSASVHVAVVSEAVTYLDYTVAAAGSASGVTLSVAGFATNGTDRANFDLDTHLSGSEAEGFGITLDYLLTVPTRGGFRIDMEAESEGIFTETIVSTLNLQARGEHGTVVVAGSETNGTGSYTIRVNGELFATITVTAGGDPVFASAGGEALTEAELAAMQDVFSVFGNGSAVFDVLADPVS